MQISPLDGRYNSKIETLSDYFSEFALIKYRVLVEIEYFIALCEIPLKQLEAFPKEKINALRDFHTNLSESDAESIKEIEHVTNHDVKAVEYFIKDKMENLGLQSFLEFVHFGLTSQDINNTAQPLMLKDALDHAYYPNLLLVSEQLESLSADWEGHKHASANPWPTSITHITR